MGIVISAVGAFLLKLLQIVFFLVVFFLLFVIVMLCLFLFCPVRYKGAAEYDGNLMAQGKVTWLCSLLSVSFSYQEGKAGSKIRIFGIDLLKVLEKRQRHEEESEKQNTRKEKKRKKGKSKDKRQENQPDLQMSQVEESPAGNNLSGDEAEKLPVKEDASKQEEKELFLKENLSEEETGIEAVIPDLEVSQIQEEKSGRTDLTISEGKEEEKAGRSEKAKAGIFLQRIREWLQLQWKKVQRFFRTLRQIFAKVKRKAEWLGQLKEFWKSENTQGMVCIFKDNVLHLLRKLKPKVLRGTIFFGTGDPCMTGQLLGVAAILYAIYGKGIQVVPDFEEARLEGELYARGRLSMITVLLIVIRILRSNEWKQFRYDLDQLKEAL